jgi:uncharacterized DUF497 family protein
VKVTWDPDKAEENLRKHGISFDEAKTVFMDPLIVTIYDDEHSEGEHRYVSIRESTRRKTLVVWFTLHGDDPHLIGARQATRVERRRYMRGDEIRDEPPLSEMKDEYDFTNGVRGSFYLPNLRMPVWLDPDVHRAFPTEKAVNEALRYVMKNGIVHEISTDD